MFYDWVETRITSDLLVVEDVVSILIFFLWLCMQLIIQANNNKSKTNLPQYKHYVKFIYTSVCCKSVFGEVSPRLWYFAAPSSISEEAVSPSSVFTVGTFKETEPWISSWCERINSQKYNKVVSWTSLYLWAYVWLAHKHRYEQNISSDLSSAGRAEPCWDSPHPVLSLDRTQTVSAEAQNEQKW